MENFYNRRAVGLEGEADGDQGALISLPVSWWGTWGQCNMVLAEESLDVNVFKFNTAFVTLLLSKPPISSRSLKCGVST